MNWFRINIDDKQNVWFRGRDVALILGYNDTDQALRKNVSEKYRKIYPVSQTDQVRHHVFISEPGLYELIFSSKLEIATKFREWVFEHVLPAISKYDQYKLFDNPKNHMFKIENETDLHRKVVHYIRRFYPEAIMVAGLGENQDTASKRINSWKRRYMKGQPDIIMNNHKEYNALCIEFKSLTNNYEVREAQLEMKKRYK